jgi:galactoside O-acetyltransferase
VILPGVTLEEGVAAGANCLITKSFKPFSVLFGSPAKVIKQRSQKVLDLEKTFL